MLLFRQRKKRFFERSNQGIEDMQRDLTKGNVLSLIIRFSVPYLLSCFMQTFYGLADLFFAGRFNGADVITGVSVGSQVMHMLTVIIVGLAMGTTVNLSRAVGGKEQEKLSAIIGNTVILFALFAVCTTVILLISAKGIVQILSTPREAAQETWRYLMVCFAGIPFITAYNVIAGIFRGMGDSRSPMYFIAIAGILNIFLDYVFMGPGGMGALGAALATVIAQMISVLISIMVIRRTSSGISVTFRDIRLKKPVMAAILRTGIPISCQDGFIQVAFIIITIIANHRGLMAAASVGIVEKIISFLFLVPSAMLSTVSVIVSQNAGAGLHRRGLRTLCYALFICIIFGILVTIFCQFRSEEFVELFTSNEPEVVRMGGQYLRSYVFDTIFAGIHFCFSGYFCAYNRAILSFIQNVICVVTARIPLAYLFSVLYPDTLYPMGWATPIGSLEGAVICILIFAFRHKNWIRESECGGK